MADEYRRGLERDAAQGDPMAARRHLCYSIAKLQIEVALQPGLMHELGKGTYKGQTLWANPETGVTHPCVKWKTETHEQFWDLVSYEKVHERQITIAATMSLGTMISTVARSVREQQMIIPTSLAPELQRLLEGSEHRLGDFDVIENPFMSDDEMLVVQREPTIGRMYPARFPTLEDDRVDAIRYAAHARAIQQGEDDEAEREESPGGGSRDPADEG